MLLASGLTHERIAGLLKPYGIEDLKRADANLQSMAGEPHTRKLLSVILRDLLDTVAETADPDQALTHWERYLQAGVNRSQLFQYLAGVPRMLHVLCSIFGNSPSLAETVIRDPLLVYWLADEQVVTRRPSRAHLERALRAMLANVAAAELKLEAIRRFKRREMLRIGVRDLLHVSDVPATTQALSDLASVLIQSAYEIAESDLRSRHGVPMHRDRTGGLKETGFAVIAMGKLGGGELNYSSDVDLIYVYGSEEGETIAPAGHPGMVTSIPNEEYFEYLARALTKALSEPTHEGSVFRVDLRLRPEGSVGPLARSLAHYRQYYRTRGQAWERQALLKARPIAGSQPIGQAFLRMVKPFVFGWSDSAPENWHRVIREVRETKAMIDHHVAARGHERRNVKLGIGGIREIEFLVQAAQMIGGRLLPEVHVRNTVAALARFRQEGLLSSREYAVLAEAYLFLRNVEHKLQMVYDLQTHAIPENEQELRRCAVRLGYPAGERDQTARRFLKQVHRHTAGVHTMFLNLINTPERCPLLQGILKRLGRSHTVR